MGGGVGGGVAFMVGEGGSFGTLTGGIEVVAAAGAVVGTGGMVAIAGLLVGVAGVEGLYEGSELSMESLRSAYPLIYYLVSSEYRPDTTYIYLVCQWACNELPPRDSAQRSR